MNLCWVAADITPASQLAGTKHMDEISIPISAPAQAQCTELARERPHASSACVDSDQRLLDARLI
jgi:hypothetical protein